MASIAQRYDRSLLRKEERANPKGYLLAEVGSLRAYFSMTTDLKEIRDEYSLRITEVEARAASIPLDVPLRTAQFEIHSVDTVFVDVHTNEGVSGLSWIFAFGHDRVKVLKGMVDDLAGLAVGEDPLMIERLWQKMWRSVGFIGQQGVTILGMSAIDTALWDIAGKVAGLPLYRLLGGYRSEVEAYASQGLWLHNSLDELAEQAQSYVEQGFTGMKMRLGKPDPQEDLERVRVVREAIGPDVALMVDVNQGWDVKTAIRMGRELEAYDLYWIEEPLPYHDVAGMAEVRAALSTAICTGETNYTKLDFLRLLEAKAADIMMPDLMRMGGVTEFRKVAALCEAYNAPVTPHLFMEVSAHLAGACPNAIWQEYQPWWQDCFAEPITFEDGALQLSDRPGLGLEWDREVIETYLL